MKVTEAFALPRRRPVFLGDFSPPRGGGPSAVSEMNQGTDFKGSNLRAPTDFCIVGLRSSAPPRPHSNLKGHLL